VPKGMAILGTGFSFSLPIQLVQMAAGAAMEVTAPNREPLPAPGSSLRLRATVL
jgi:hypothetical protein